MAKKITLKNKNGDTLCPHTAIEQVQGLKEALDGKLDGSGAIDVVGAINITGTDSTQSKLTFARETFNYIAAKGKIGIAPNNTNQTSEYGFWFSNEGVIPGTSMSNSYNLGSSSVKWRNVYATTFNGTATAVIDGSISTSKIATAAITSAKIQTSIALNGTPSMTVEPTTSSPDKTIASVGFAKQVVADLEIDTRNLLTNSREITIDASTLTSGTKMSQKKLPISVEVGDVLTFSCEDLVINAGTDETHAILLYEPSIGSLAVEKYISPTSKTATITVTKASTTPYLYMYAGFSDDSAGKSITYKGATLVKGDKPMLLWQRAVEDLDDVADYTVMPNLISASDFELGGINDSAGANYDSVTRVRTKNYIPVSAPKITLKSWTDGVVFYLWTYDTNKNPIQMSFSSTGWVSSTKYTYTLPTGTAYIRVVMKKLSGANFTASELTTIKIKAENGSKATDWQPSATDMQVARPTVYYQSTQPSTLTAHEGDIWIVS